jgi:hypothetical protein
MRGEKLTHRSMNAVLLPLIDGLLLRRRLRLSVRSTEVLQRRAEFRSEERLRVRVDAVADDNGLVAL